MALKTTFDETNRVIESSLTVSYSKMRISGSWSWTNNMNEGGSYRYMIEYHRYATKRYRYIGMTDEAKNACVAAMLDLYYVPRYEQTWQESGGSWSTAQLVGYMPIATVTPEHNPDGSWDVAIDVNEDDVRYSEVTDNVLYPTSLFSHEQSYDYDDEQEVLPGTGGGDDD